MYELIETPVTAYPTIEQAITDLKGKNRADYAAKNLKVSEDGIVKFDFAGSKGSKSLKFTKSGMIRMLRELSIPKGFAFKVIDNELLTENINELLQLVTNAQVITEGIEGGEFVTGFRKEFISPFRDYEILETIQNEFPKNTEVRLLTRNENGMRLHYFDKDFKLPDMEYNGDTINFGGNIEYSEYGYKPFKAELALLIMWCTNGAVMSDKKYSYQYKHGGDRFKAISGVQQALLNISKKDISEFTQVFDEMKRKSMSEEFFKSAVNTTKKHYSDFDMTMEQRPTVSFWDMFSEITRIAHEQVVDFDERRALEVFAGKMVMSVKNPMHTDKLRKAK